MVCILCFIVNGLQVFVLFIYFFTVVVTFISPASSMPHILQLWHNNAAFSISQWCAWLRRVCHETHWHIIHYSLVTWETDCKLLGNCVIFRFFDAINIFFKHTSFLLVFEFSNVPSQKNKNTTTHFCSQNVHCTHSNSYLNLFIFR